jgi:hypothetical protein
MTDEQFKEARQKGLCFFCKEHGHLAKDCAKKKNALKKKFPLKKGPGGKFSTKEAFSHIKQIVSDMDEEDYAEFTKQMSELTLPDGSF